MTAFRGSDERLEREIETLEAIARVRVRRVASEIRDIERDLTELRRERARRRATGRLTAPEGTPSVVES
jgi:hypothetical protein